MKTTVIPTKSKRRHSSGFTLLEVLLGVAVLSMIAAVAIFAVSSLTAPARSTKLRSDVTALNNAVRTFLVSGGQIAASASGDEVLTALKSAADAESGKKLAALRGSTIDRRLKGLPITAPGAERAVWNGTKMRFEIATAGSGFRSFALTASDAAPVTETARKGTLDLAVKDNWIWDFSENAAPREAPREIYTSDVVIAEAPAPSAITQLAAPEFSIKSGLYDFSSFSPNLTVSLIDTNAPGLARIMYSVDGSRWEEYRPDKPLQIPPDLTTAVRAYAIPAFSEESYESSAVQTEIYETIFFTGNSSGVFFSPTGDRGLITNLLGLLRSPQFLWGSPATNDKKQNELRFAGASFNKIAPDQEFKLGTLSYYNGTTYSNTNATAVQVAVEMNMSTPQVKETLQFEFRLLSTPNKGKNADEDADYVWIPDVSTNFRTVIKGKSFALVLRFGEHSNNGFTTIDTFHAHEGKTLQGTIYGRLTEVK